MFSFFLGIQVRQGEHTFYMHHKFAIIDKKLLINGSFNWTRNAVFGNSENVHVSNDQNLTANFQEEFERLWELYDPLKLLDKSASSVSHTP